jgi:hypothetical protein
MSLRPVVAPRSRLDLVLAAGLVEAGVEGDPNHKRLMQAPHERLNPGEERQRAARRRQNLVAGVEEDPVQPRARNPHARFVLDDSDEEEEEEPAAEPPIVHAEPAASQRGPLRVRLNPPPAPAQPRGSAPFYGDSVYRRPPSPQRPEPSQDRMDAWWAQLPREGGRTVDPLDAQAEETRRRLEAARHNLFE